VVVKAIQVSAVSRARGGRAAGQMMLPVRAVKVLPARATLVRETRAKGPRARAIPETLVRASQAKAIREAAARDRIEKS